jgi:hypothetical protein
LRNPVSFKGLVATFRPFVESPEQLSPVSATALSASAAPDSVVQPTPDAVTRPRVAARSVAFFAAALLCCVLGYLAISIPGSWFPSASPRAWNARDLTLARGAGSLVGDDLVIAALDASGNALVTLTSDMRSSEFAAISWTVTDVPEGADAKLFWRSDVRPDKLNSAPVAIDGGHALPAIVAGNPDWIGRVTGLALAIHGTALTQPIHVRGVSAKPMGARELIGDRAGEWLAFEGWNGASINTLTGGADIQDLPLPMLLAAALLLSGAASFAWRRFRPASGTAPLAAILLGTFVLAWFVLDARWTWNLARQVRLTASTYAGKDVRDKHLAMEDGPLYAFIEKARAVMPPAPARVFVVADLAYFRNRAAYHLYPNNVFAEPASNAMPPAARLRPGDWLLLYQHRGVQFDRTLGKLRWDSNQEVAAELKLVEPGSALFLIR